MDMEKTKAMPVVDCPEWCGLISHYYTIISHLKQILCKQRQLLNLKLHFQNFVQYKYCVTNNVVCLDWFIVSTFWNSFIYVFYFRHKWDGSQYNSLFTFVSVKYVFMWLSMMLLISAALQPEMTTLSGYLICYCLVSSGVLCDTHSSNYGQQCAG